MPRPIDADAVTQAIKGVHCKGCNNYHGVRCRACDFDVAMDAIEDAPTLDYAPVRHGEWGAAEIVGYDGIHAVWARKCSECGRYSTAFGARYCSACGALMDRKKKV